MVRNFMELENRIKDPVQQFLELRENLQQERSVLVERIQQINKVLAPLTIEAMNRLSLNPQK
jgi:hypothetical protein